jgi:peroxiredoxin
MAIATNQVAPDFELPSNEMTADGKLGKKYKLSDFRGKPVVLAFYPLDFSPVCTNENACFRDDLSKFASVGAQVFGVSVDSMWCHKAFAESLKLAFPLLADFQPKGAMSAAYGLYNEEKGFSKRATVVIGKDGKVAWVKEHDGQRSNDELISVLQKLG